MDAQKVTDPNDPNFNPDDLLPQEEQDPYLGLSHGDVDPNYDPSKPQTFGGYTNPDQTSSPQIQSIAAPGTPYGNQPGSQDTGISPPGTATPTQAPAPTQPTSTNADPGSSYAWENKDAGTTDENGQTTYPSAPSVPMPSPTAGSTGGGYTIPQGLPVPAGFDATKWNDPNKSDPKYDVGRMVAGGATNDQIKAMLAAKYPGWNVSGTDIITDPQGNQFDFRFDQEGANKPMWEQTGGGTGTGTTSGSIGAGTGAGLTGAYAPFSSSSPFGGQASSIEEAIMRLLGRGEAPVGASDPNIAGPTAAYRAQQDRSVRRARGALAERAAAEGLNNGGTGSGAFDSAIQSQLESEGMNVGGYQANLMVQEIQARRQDVVNALNFAQGDEKMQLQWTLAQMDDQIRRLQLSQQNNQFYDQFAYTAAKDQTDYDRLLTNALLNG